MTRTAVIAGVGPGLGESIARTFASNGCNVALFARSADYIEELAEELKERFDLSEEKGRDLLERLQEISRENQEKLESVARQEVKDACERMGVVSRDEFDKLKKKVAALEKKLQNQ